MTAFSICLVIIARADAQTMPVESSPPRAVLLAPAAGIQEHAWPEAEDALRGELAALNIPVDRVPGAAATPAEREVELVAQAAAHQASIAVGIFRQSDSADIVYWVTDRSTGKMRLRTVEFVAGDGGTGEARTIAVRTIEMLRAALLELGIELSVSPPVLAPVDAPRLPRATEHGPSVKDTESWTIAAGADVLWPFAVPLASMTLRREFAGTWAGRLCLQYGERGSVLANNTARARARVLAATLGADRNLHVTAAAELSVWAGITWLRLQVDGSATAPLQSHSTAANGAMPATGVEVRYRLWSGLYFWANVQGGLLLSPVIIHLAAAAQRPFGPVILEAAAGLGMAW